MNTKFSELTEVEQQARLAEYAQKDAELGTQTVLARIVKPSKINDLKNGAKQAIVRVAIYDKETKETSFKNMFQYIAEGKDALEAFYAGLKKGQLVSVQYKENNGFNNIYTLMDRSASDKKVVVETVESELTV